MGCVWVLVKENNIFSQYLCEEGVFADKKFLTSSFIPDKISHRDEEISQISSVLAPVLRNYKPSNLFIYGTCGTGKTICTKFIVNQLENIVNGSGHRLKVVYINCKMKKVADTEYRLFSHLLKELGECVPDTGLPTYTLYRRFFEKVEKMNCTLVLVLDEIDTLIKKVGDEFLYNLVRTNIEMKNSHISLVGITNDLAIRDSLDLRVKSSLSEEEVLFKPYNAAQLMDILSERAKHGFRDGVVEQSSIGKCAAIAAQEHGDARRALDLLRVAGETAERMSEGVVAERHVDIARQKIDLDRVAEAVKSQPMHSQLILHTILKLREKRDTQNKWADRRILTGETFGNYKEICQLSGIKPLTQRRISDLIGELDMLGIIKANVISNGRYGRTREIIVLLEEPVLGKVSAYLSSKFG